PDLRRRHGRTGLRRIVPGDGRPEHALRQAHAAILGELLRGHDLAAGDARHVGDDGLDLRDAVIAEELADLAHHGTPFTLTARVHGLPPPKRRTTPGETDCSSPATRAAIAPRARSGVRVSRGTPRSPHPGDEPLP